MLSVVAIPRVIYIYRAAKYKTITLTLLTGATDSNPYPYTWDLIALASQPRPIVKSLPSAITRITTPLNYEAWELCLSTHPDKQLVNYILDGITHGFRIGFNYAAHRCTPATNNLPSAEAHPEVVQKSIDTEVGKGRLLGPFDPREYPQVQISSLGVIPKKHTKNKWRMILDLSHPENTSVNDGINKPLCSLSYMKVDDVVQEIVTKGQGTLIAKLDIESAFRNVPVHPQDRLLLGMLWKGALYIDAVLPFGLRSAPKIFNTIADAAQYIAIQKGVSYLEHFLDDFITLGAPRSQECATNLEILANTCKILRLPVAPNKKEGPATTLVFLGIELDTVNMQLRLPAEKLQRLKLTASNWLQRKFCKKKDLESLIGLLQDASHVIRPGRTFVRHLIDALTKARLRPSTSLVRLNSTTRSDILWWCRFIENWNGLSMMHNLQKAHPDIALASDTSGQWGCGAFWQDHWFQYQWDGFTTALHINNKELVPIVIAIAVWGHLWHNKSVLCLCDNQAVVHIVNSGTSRDPTAMGLMHCLFFIAAKYNLLLSAQHLPGPSNDIADALSRNRLHHFYSRHPQARPHPTPIPQQLIALISHKKPDWTSQLWTKMFNSIFSQPTHHQPSAPIHAQTHGTSTSATNQDSAIPIP